MCFVGLFNGIAGGFGLYDCENSMEVVIYLSSLLWFVLIMTLARNAS